MTDFYKKDCIGRKSATSWGRDELLRWCKRYKIGCRQTANKKELCDNIIAFLKDTEKEIIKEEEPQQHFFTKTCDKPREGWTALQLRQMCVDAGFKGCSKLRKVAMCNILTDFFRGQQPAEQHPPKFDEKKLPPAAPKELPIKAIGKDPLSIVLKMLPLRDIISFCSEHAILCTRGLMVNILDTKELSMQLLTVKRKDKAVVINSEKTVIDWDYVIFRARGAYLKWCEHYGIDPAKASQGLAPIGVRTIDKHTGKKGAVMLGFRYPKTKVGPIGITHLLRIIKCNIYPFKPEIIPTRKISDKDEQLFEELDQLASTFSKQTIMKACKR